MPFASKNRLQEIGNYYYVVKLVTVKWLIPL